MGGPSGRQAAVVLGAVLSLTAAAAAGCGGGSSGPRPTAALASSAEAQASFRPLLSRWERLAQRDRPSLEPEMRAFVGRFRDDPLAHFAEVLLAWTALERGRLEEAASAARALGKDRAGTAADLCTLVEGAALRRTGKPVEALERLAPLGGKLIDAWARELFAEEVVLAALEASRWEAAVGHMRAALREAESDRGALRQRAEQQLQRVPSDELVRELDRIQLRVGAGAGADPLAELIARRLAQIVREQGDGGLAKHLLSRSGALLGAEGDAVATVAASTSMTRIEGRTVGVLLSLRTEETRRRSAEVAAGLAHGLGMPGSGARLVSRDEGGQLEGIEAALTRLGSDGAALLVGGVDRNEATRAAQFAAAREIPMMLMHPPEPGAPGTDSPYVFVAGEDPRSQAELLVRALVAARATPIAIVGDGPKLDAETTKMTAHACDPRLSGEAWCPPETRGVVLNGGASCASSALEGLMRRPVRIGAGLDAGLDRRLPAGSLVLEAGSLIFDARATIPTSLRVWVERSGRLPGWWTALGRDAGALAGEALRSLPEDATENTAEVKARRERGAAAVGGATAELWTTASRGFGGGRVLARAVTVRSVEAPSP